MKHFLIFILLLSTFFYLISSNDSSFLRSERHNKHNKRTESKDGRTKFAQFLLTKGATFGKAFLYAQGAELVNDIATTDLQRGMKKFVDDKIKGGTNVVQTVCSPKFHSYGTEMFNDVKDSYDILSNKDPTVTAQQKFDQLKLKTALFGYNSFLMYGLYKMKKIRSVTQIIPGLQSMVF